LTAFSLRSRPQQLEAIKAKHDPDVIGIQESKVADDAFPLDMIQGLGDEPHYRGQKGHNGVALLSKAAPLAVCKGFPNDGEDAQRRVITGRFTLPDGETVSVFNGYFPQGESRDHPTKFPGK
jgi:exodeoxyribonuclease-3